MYTHKNNTYKITLQPENGKNCDNEQNYENYIKRSVQIFLDIKAKQGKKQTYYYKKEIFWGGSMRTRPELMFHGTLSF